MMEGRDDLRLALTPRQAILVAGELVRQRLDRHGTTEPRILREEHHTHSAATELAFDLLRSDAPLDRVVEIHARVIT
ncbi:MAG: hypothetical protein L6Q92_03540 [Phycisphaerae bacterium]|nr:hypothetical protein [Phycisphaerae bacterium]